MTDPINQIPVPTPDDIAAFQRDGAVVLRQAVSEHWQDQLAAAIERDIENPGPFFNGYHTDSGRFHGNLRLWENDDAFRAYCFESPLPAIAARFLASDKINLFYDQLFVKEPGTPQPTRWHNDQPYWPVRGWPVMSFWLALDPVTRQSGGMEFIAGSHKWERWFQPSAFAEGGDSYERGPNYEDIPDFDAERDKHTILSWDMNPGDVIAFHALTVHGAGGNLRSDVRRRGYVVRYCGREAVYYGGPGPNAGLRNAELSDGMALDSGQFPVVWTVS